MSKVVSTFNSCLYLGEVMHQRTHPMQYKFKYSVLSVKLDIDEVDELAKSHSLLKFNRFGVFSFYSKDYGARTEQSWREWLESLLPEYGVKTFARAELVAFPRFLGFTFNPLAMWFVYDENEHCIAVIAEVSNTFGHWHHYVLTNQGQPIDSLESLAEKVFHVSPFIGMSCQYRFRIGLPKSNYRIGIYQSENSQPMFVATQAAKSMELTNRTLFKAALLRPFNTLKVMTMIHWWALKIWLKGGKFHRTPDSQRAQVYSHSEMHVC